jgi:intracellular sulfur oxidation DsrE/DsrF family protein
MKTALGLIVAMAGAGHALAAPLPPPAMPVTSDAYGFVVVKSAAIQPDKAHVYKAIFSATQGGDKPGERAPAIQMAGTELNALVASGLGLSNADFVVDFHGPGAVWALLDNKHYRAKFGTDNPNLAALATLKKSGVKLYVCAQQMMAQGVAFDSITQDVTVASDGLVVLMTFQNKGYALLPF